MQRENHYCFPFNPLEISILLFVLRCKLTLWWLLRFIEHEQVVLNKTGVSKGRGVYKGREQLDQLLSVKVELGIACWVFVTDNRQEKKIQGNQTAQYVPSKELKFPCLYQWVMLQLIWERNYFYLFSLCQAGIVQLHHSDLLSLFFPIQSLSCMHVQILLFPPNSYFQYIYTNGFTVKVNLSEVRCYGNCSCF